MTVASERLTLEAFLRLPAEEPPNEFADGVVTPKMSPKGRHAVLQAELIKQLDSCALPGKLARVFPELRVTFGGASYVPDLVLYRWQRVPVEPDGQVANDFFLPPDIAIEIASPEQSITALVRRCLWYVANGVQLALLVDPADQSVLAFRPCRPATAWCGSDRIDLSELLPTCALTVDDLFAALRHE